MAAGRHVGYKFHDFRALHAEIEVSRNKQYHLERYREELVRCDGNMRKSKYVDGLHRLPLHCGNDRVQGHFRKIVHREPGKLSSESGYNGTPEVRTKDVKTRDKENGFGLPNKKRKFSRIVWDKKDEEKNDAITLDVRNEVSLPVALHPLAPLRHQQIVQDSGAVVPETIGQASEVELEVSVDLPENQNFANCEESQLMDEEVEEEYPSTRSISSSRWADVDKALDDNNVDANVQKSELNDVMPKMVASSGIGKAISREGYVGARSKSSESAREYSDEQEVEDGRSNCMNIDRKDDGEYRFDHLSVFNSEAEDEGARSMESVCQPQRSTNMIQGCRSIDEFEKLNKIGEGTYGVVYRAKDKKTGEIVALKKEVVLSRDLQDAFMVMEYMEHDIKGLMETMRQPFSQSEVKCLMYQLISGVKYLHDNWVLHRDLKTSNLLFNNRGEVEICDFGLSRQYGSLLNPYTELVVTLWYRAPELLLGTKEYSTAIDMWSLGCIMAELLGKEPLFKGKTEIDQLDKIFRLLGNPSPDIWPRISELPGWKSTLYKQKYRYNRLREKFPAASFSGQPTLSEAGFSLLNKLLTFDPEKRITAEAALNDAWFHEIPLPKSKEFMPTYPARRTQNRAQIHWRSYT